MGNKCKKTAYIRINKSKEIRMVQTDKAEEKGKTNLLKENEDLKQRSFKKTGMYQPGNQRKW